MESQIRREAQSDYAATVREPMRVDFVEGASPSMPSVEAIMREVAQSEVPVLLLAERGVGMKATARRVHDLSTHGRHTFRVISCTHFGSEKSEDSTEPAGVIGAGTGFLEELA